MKYQRKETYDAVQWTGTNEQEVIDFINGGNDVRVERSQIIFPTRIGSQSAAPTDWIVRTRQNENLQDIAPMIDAAFQETFVSADAPPPEVFSTKKAAPPVHKAA